MICTFGNHWTRVMTRGVNWLGEEVSSILQGLGCRFGFQGFVWYQMNCEISW